MSTGWPYTALRATLPHATPEPGASVDAKPLKNIRSLSTLRNPSHNTLRCTLRNKSRVSIAVIRSLNPSHKSSRATVFDVSRSLHVGRLTCENINGFGGIEKGVAKARDRRYRSINPRASRHIQGANPMTRYMSMPESRR